MNINSAQASISKCKWERIAPPLDVLLVRNEPANLLTLSKLG